MGRSLAMPSTPRFIDASGHKEDKNIKWIDAKNETQKPITELSKKGRKK